MQPVPWVSAPGAAGDHMAEGSSDDDLDWFERAVKEHGEPAARSASEAVEDGEAAESGGPGAPTEEGPPGIDASVPESSGDTDLPSDQAGADAPDTDESVPEGPDVDPATARDTMDDIAAAFGVDTADQTGAEVPADTDESFGFDVDTGGRPGSDFGFGVSQEYDTFEEEEYQTDVPRVDIGIEGLDEMIQGGVPDRALIVTIGGAGTGKTTFGLQFLNEALANDERGVFITLEESKARILKSAREKGWPFDEYEEAGKLAVVDLDPVDMANSLTSIRSELPRLVEEFGASRLVLDSVSLLEMMYDDQATRRTEIYDFARSLKQAGVTTMLTSESDDDNPFASRYGVIEYLTDAVVILRYVRPEDFRETRLAIEIQKIRDANHSRETKPYEITSTGISVYRQANIF